MARNFFNTTTSRDLFQLPYAQAGGSAVLHGSGEIDLRSELDEFFFGYNSGVRHGNFVLIRRMRRDSTGKKIACSCLHPITREADPDCSFCSSGSGDAEGYLWSETWAWSFSTYGGGDGGLINRIINMPPGQLRVDFKVFYFRYDVDIRYGDKIVEVRLDEEGNITLPFTRETIYSPQTIERKRSDNSRIEFYTVHCREDQALRLDFPR